MDDSFLTFQRFDNPELADAFGEMFANAGIPYAIEKQPTFYDPAMSADIPAADIHLKISGEDFARAHALLESYYAQQLNDVDPDYYLHSFTDKELMEIISQPDEWGHFDYVLARKLLADRGRPVSDETAARLKKARIEALARYDDPSLPGFGVSPLGIGGMMVGSVLSDRKKTLPDGRQVHAYAPSTRKYGKLIFVVGVIGVLLMLLLRLLKMHATL